MFFFLVHRFHSISFTRAQSIPKYKIGFGRFEVSLRVFVPACTCRYIGTLRVLLRLRTAGASAVMPPDLADVALGHLRFLAKSLVRQECSSCYYRKLMLRLFF